MTMRTDEILSDDRTTIGNYFVSNYPPYSFWTPQQLDQARAALERPPAPDTPLGIYVHIPFCRKRCRFCYFKVYTDQDSSAVNRYLDGLVRELTLYADKPFLGGRKPKFIYFGGGTPSFISTKQLSRLVEAMKALFPWDEAEEVTFECEPGTLTRRKLEILREIGVSRLSLGVENFDDRILELNNRAHGSQEIDRAYEMARSLGFPQINIDLIAGMIGETDENWSRCVRKTIELDPDNVTVYQMEVPYNTTISKELRTDGEEAPALADWGTKRRWVDDAFRDLEIAGYTLTSAYTAVKDVGRTSFLYRDLLWRGADMMALGVASFSHVNGVHYQNESGMEPYLAKVERGEIPMRRALVTTAEERMIREFILQMKTGRVDRQYFASKFQIDLEQRFRSPLKSFEKQGLLSLNDRAIEMSRPGLLQVDKLLYEFFLPEHREAAAA